MSGANKPSLWKEHLVKVIQFFKGILLSLWLFPYLDRTHSEISNNYSVHCVISIHDGIVFNLCIYLCVNLYREFSQLWQNPCKLLCTHLVVFRYRLIDLSLRLWHHNRENILIKCVTFIIMSWKIRRFLKNLRRFLCAPSLRDELEPPAVLILYFASLNPKAMSNHITKPFTRLHFLQMLYPLFTQLDCPFHGQDKPDGKLWCFYFFVILMHSKISIILGDVTHSLASLTGWRSINVILSIAVRSISLNRFEVPTSFLSIVLCLYVYFTYI